MFPGKWYDEVRVGERFGTSVTVTEAHLVLGSGLRIQTGLPLTTLYAQFAYQNAGEVPWFGRGNLGRAPTTAGIDAHLEYPWKFNDRVSLKPKHKGGICVLRGTAHNQRGELVVEAEGKILVSARASR